MVNGLLCRAAPRLGVERSTGILLTVTFCPGGVGARARFLCCLPSLRYRVAGIDSFRPGLFLKRWGISKGRMRSALAVRCSGFCGPLVQAALSDTVYAVSVGFLAHSVAQILGCLE